VSFRPSPVAESDEEKTGVILDYDEEGNLVGLEVLDASRRVGDVRSMEFQVTEYPRDAPTREERPARGSMGLRDELPGRLPAGRANAPRHEHLLPVVRSVPW